MSTISHLAYIKTCDGCGQNIYMAISRDGRWRPFEMRRVPAAPHGVWSWRKRYGMEEQDQFPGYVIHFCADYHDLMNLDGWLPAAGIEAKP
jgi:hypothetical protein